VQFEPTFVPLNAEGLPMSLDAVSLCDTNSESYGSCKLNITVLRRAVSGVLTLQVSVRQVSAVECTLWFLRILCYVVVCLCCPVYAFKKSY